MPPKMDQDTTPGVRLLRLFRKLMLDGRKHFQLDLADEFQCSPQSIIRMTGEIEAVVGASLESGLEHRKRWYRIKTLSRSRLGLDFEELRYLSVCRDLASPTLPQQVRTRIDDTIFNLSVLMADTEFAEREKAQKPQFAFFSKGRIDYSPFYEYIEKLLEAAEKNCICLVQYRASGKQVAKEHRFAMGRMASMNNALYALGASVTDDLTSMKHPTNFAVHRILDVTLTDKNISFEIPATDFATFGLPWHEPRTFHIRFAPGKAADYVRERIWAENQEIRELKGGGLELKITTRSEPELFAWMRSFGEEAELVSK
jgi:hypothetical protein